WSFPVREVVGGLRESLRCGSSLRGCSPPDGPRAPTARS
ncbi:MAG: hypothetical protein AVDCRST_MAG61-3218, partial [uncultured Friedmanniella sp.]